MNSYKALEYDKIKEKLAEHAISGCAKELCRALEPYKTIEEARTALAETDEVHILLMKFGAPHFSELTDITNSCKRAESGSVLTIKELLDIGAVLKIARNIHDFLENRCEETVLFRYYESLMPNKYFEEKITISFLSEDEVSDNASPALREIRRKQAQAKAKIRSILDGILHSQTHQKHLQDTIVTIRNDRYVIPVKAEHKNEIGGLVHDVSSSGATLFVEPLQVVQANNELSVLAADEHREIERILAELSAEAGTFSGGIIQNFEIARHMDFLFAKARYAQSLDATIPELNEDGKIVAVNARHPLIAKEKVVPVSFSLGTTYDSLIITGPNTGGKTVTLKTTGLLCLMAKSGLFVPAKNGVKIAFFDEIYADIGDEQSIEQSLSTFSSHMKNIVSIMANVTERSLVLLDELGSGTDPAEGAALAISIIENIASKGAKLMCTTHYAELKVYALQTVNVENASCEFDVATLMPTYRLVIGIPGKSNAFAIASKLGMDESVIENAGNLLSSETVKVEKVLADLEIKRKSIEVDSERAAELRYLAEQRIKEVEEELEKKVADAEREAAKQKAKAHDILEKAKRDTQYMMRQIDELKKAKDKEDFRERINKTKKEIEDITTELETQTSTEKKRVKKPIPRPLQVGDTVIIFSLNKEATVIAPPDSKGNVMINTGFSKTKINIKDLELCEKKKKKENESSTVLSLEKGSRNAQNEIDIRGMTADEADGIIDDVLNNAMLAGLNIVSIIHGKGTGALRAAVHAKLKKHPIVKEFRLGVYGEGETGVTIVTLKNQ